jgi:hypothetical protein
MTDIERGKSWNRKGIKQREKKNFKRNFTGNGSLRQAPHLGMRNL